MADAIVYVDVDGVLASTSTPVAAHLGAIYDPTQWDFGLSKAPADFDRTAFWSWFGEQAADLPVLPGAQDFVERLRGRFRVVFATSPMDSRTWMYERQEWLKRHFSAKLGEIMQGSAKDCLGGFALIDDKPSNHSRAQALSILPDWPYNRGPEAAHLYRAYSYNEIWKVLRGQA